ncbi:hypothetical protein [Acinetobacter sp. 5862]|uniref:hypothetical protein n=1 Tax=Acinetobacter sp. 5862 TaxID=2967169 RepID=UPI002112577E|nr:hypothetical protein [Acinetobacter sp. 5862]
MSKVSKVANLITALLIVGSISYCSYSFGSAESRMRQTCSEITSGMSVVALSAFAKEHGLNLPRQESGVIFMVESKTLGRWGCRVTLEKGMVQSAEYNFAD